MRVLKSGVGRLYLIVVVLDLRIRGRVEKLRRHLSGLLAEDSPMKMSFRVVAVALTILTAGSHWSLAAEGQTSTSTLPPKNLKLVGDHWTPWDPPQATAESYLIQRGDTLWDLSSKWLGDPHLWPQVWDQNRYVLDSHWIYPGDPLAIPAKPNVVPPEGQAPAAEAQPPAAETGSEAVAAAPVATETAPSTGSTTPAMISLADAHDLS